MSAIELQFRAARVGGRRFVALLVALVATMLVSVLGPAPVSAHTDFDSSDPADGSVIDQPVDVVTLVFTGEATAVDDEIVALTPDGILQSPSSVETDDGQIFVARFDPPLAGGEIGFRWVFRSADAHRIEGAFTFTVTAPAVTAPAVTGPAVTAPVVTAPAVTVPAGLVPAAPVVAGAFGARQTAGSTATDQRRATSDRRSDARAASCALQETEESSSEYCVCVSLFCSMTCRFKQCECVSCCQYQCKKNILDDHLSVTRHFRRRAAVYATTAVSKPCAGTSHSAASAPSASAGSTRPESGRHQQPPPPTGAPREPAADYRARRPAEAPHRSAVAASTATGTLPDATVGGRGGR